MRFSIIIPVYNVAAYLEKGVQSVLSQTFSDFELLLINDGSTDESASVCDRLATTDNRIRTIHKPNGGASDARNRGIREAEGDFLMFLDGDDYWDDSAALQSIADKLLVSDSPDLLLFYWQFINVNTGKQIVFDKKYDTDVCSKATKEEVIKSLFRSEMFPSSSVITVTRRSFIIENQLFFEKGIKAEDIDWILKIFDRAATIEALNLNFYNVLLNRPGSVTTTADLKSIESVLFILDKWCPVLMARNDEVSRLLMGHLAFHYSTCFIVFSQLGKEGRQKTVQRLRKYRHLFQYLTVRKALLVKYLVGVFGVYRGSDIIGMLFKIRLKLR